jgi:hypothetical protein
MTQHYRSLVGRIGQCGHILVGSITDDQQCSVPPATQAGWWLTQPRTGAGI